MIKEKMMTIIMTKLTKQRGAATIVVKMKKHIEDLNQKRMMIGIWGTF